MKVFFLLAGLLFIAAGFLTPVTDHPRKVKMAVGIPPYKGGGTLYRPSFIDVVTSEREALILIKALSVCSGFGMIWISYTHTAQVSMLPVWRRFQRPIRNKKEK